MVLHDLNQAARFADYIIALKAGEIVKAGTCEEVITTTSIARCVPILMRKLESIHEQINLCALHIIY